MSAIGNLFLALAALCYMGMLSLVYGTHNRSGDAGVGYAYAVFFVNLGFVACMTIVAALIGGKGGFAWVGATTSSRFLIATAGYLLVIMGASFFTFGEGVGKLPPVLAALLKIMPAVLPAIALLGAGFLLNTAVSQAGPPPYVRIPLYFAALVGLVVISPFLFGPVFRTGAALLRSGGRDTENDQRMISQIDTTDVMKDMVFLFVYTSSGQSKNVRTHALEKIKSRPDWQEEMIRRLDTDWAPEVFTFLSANDVDNPALFAEPLKRGLRTQARLIREYIRTSRSYDLYPDSFSWEVERALRSVDRFKGNGVNYKPNVEEILHALDEPKGSEKPDFSCRKTLEKWLKAH